MYNEERQMLKSIAHKCSEDERQFLSEYFFRAHRAAKVEYDKPTMRDDFEEAHELLSEDSE